MSEAEKAAQETSWRLLNNIHDVQVSRNMGLLDFSTRVATQQGIERISSKMILTEALSVDLLRQLLTTLYSEPVADEIMLRLRDYVPDGTGNPIPNEM